MLPRAGHSPFPTRGDSQAPARSEATRGSRWDEAMPVSARLLQMQNSRLRQQPLEAAGASSTRTSWLLASCGAAYVASPAPRLRSTRRTTPAFAPALLDIAALPLAMAQLLLRRQPRPGATAASQLESPRVGNAGHVVQWW